MNNKEKFCKFMERVQDNAKSISSLGDILGGIVIEGKITAVLDYADEIALMYLNLDDVPDCFYEEFWNLTNFGVSPSNESIEEFYERWRRD